MKLFEIKQIFKVFSSNFTTISLGYKQMAKVGVVRIYRESKAGFGNTTRYGSYDVQGFYVQVAPVSDTEGDDFIRRRKMVLGQKNDMDLYMHSATALLECLS